MFSADQFEVSVSTVLFLILLAVKLFAFINALTWQDRYYDAAGKLNKNAWCLITGLAVAGELVLMGQPLINLIGTVAALVYLVDVRPALQALTRR